VVCNHGDVPFLNTYYSDFGRNPRKSKKERNMISILEKKNHCNNTAVRRRSAASQPHPRSPPLPAVALCRCYVSRKTGAASAQQCEVPSLGLAIKDRTSTWKSMSVVNLHS